MQTVISEEEDDIKCHLCDENLYVYRNEPCNHLVGCYSCTCSLMVKWYTSNPISHVCMFCKEPVNKLFHLQANTYITPVEFQSQFPKEMKLEEKERKRQEEDRNLELAHIVSQQLLLQDFLDDEEERRREPHMDWVQTLSNSNELHHVRAQENILITRSGRNVRAMLSVEDWNLTAALLNRVLSGIEVLEDEKDQEEDQGQENGNNQDDEEYEDGEEDADPREETNQEEVNTEEENKNNQIDQQLELTNAIIQVLNPFSNLRTNMSPEEKKFVLESNIFEIEGQLDYTDTDEDEKLSERSNDEPSRDERSHRMITRTISRNQNRDSELALDRPMTRSLLRSLDQSNAADQKQILSQAPHQAPYQDIDENSRDSDYSSLSMEMDSSNDHLDQQQYNTNIRRRRRRRLS